MYKNDCQMRVCKNCGKEDHACDCIDAHPLVEKVMSEFKKENRYIVIKRKDAALYLSEIDQIELDCMDETISNKRDDDGRKRLLECVVVEHDWPMYDDTWQAIQSYVETGSYQSNTDLQRQLDEQTAMGNELLDAIRSYVKAGCREGTHFVNQKRALDIALDLLDKTPAQSLAHIEARVEERLTKNHTLVPDSVYADMKRKCDTFDYEHPTHYK